MSDPFEDPSSFLGYVAIHSETDRHLFHRDHVKRLFELAEVDIATVEPRPLPEFCGMDQWFVKPYLEKAYANLAKKSQSAS